MATSMFAACTDGGRTACDCDCDCDCGADAVVAAALAEIGCLNRQHAHCRQSRQFRASVQKSQAERSNLCLLFERKTRITQSNKQEWSECTENNSATTNQTRLHLERTGYKNQSPPVARCRERSAKITRIRRQLLLPLLLLLCFACSWRLFASDSLSAAIRIV